MRLTKLQINQLVKNVFNELNAKQVAQYKAPEEKVFQRAVAIVEADLQKERELEEEVNRMLDELERTNGGEFQRYKMFGMVKKQLAKEKGVVL